MAAKNHATETKEEPDHQIQNENVDRPSPKVQNSRQKPKACRRLDFGSDYEKELSNLGQLSEEELEQQRQEGIAKWNFDFENEIPLEGDWKWEKVPVQVPETKEIVYSIEKKSKSNRTV